MGWVLEHEVEGVVGTLRNVAFEYEWNRRFIDNGSASADKKLQCVAC